MYFERGRHCCAGAFLTKESTGLWLFCNTAYIYVKSYVIGLLQNHLFFFISELQRSSGYKINRERHADTVEWGAQKNAAVAKNKSNFYRTASLRSPRAEVAIERVGARCIFRTDIYQ